MKKKTLRIIAVALSLVICVGLVAACGNNATPAAPAPGADAGDAGAPAQGPAAAIGPDDAGGVTLEEIDDDEAQLAEEIQIIVDNNVIAVLNPFSPAAGATSTNWVFTMIHDRLVQHIPGQGFVPGLAETWTTDDYQTFTFNLRQGVTFHNGDAFTSEDVIWTIEAVQRDGLGSSAYDQWRSVVTATAIDNYTVEIVLDEVDVDFLFGIARPPAGILNGRAMTANPETGSWIGTGAFSVEDFVSHDFALLRRNADYWGTVPVTELVRLRFVPEMATRTIMLQTGDAQLSFGTPTEDMQYFLDHDDFIVMTTTSNDPQGLAFNLANPITGDYYFRRAVHHALNRVEIAFGAAGEWADGDLQDGAYWGILTEFRNTDIPLLPLDLDLARHYLEQSSYNGEEVGIATAILTFIRAAEIIQMQLAEIGINVRVDQMDAPSLAAFATYGSTEHEMVLFFTLMNPSAGSTRHAFIPGGAQNRANFSDPAVTEMLSRARTTMDPTERGDIYREVQAIVADTLAYTNIFWRVFGIVADQHLGGIALNPDPAAHDFRNIFLRVDG